MSCKDKQQNTHKISNRQKRKNTDTIANPAPMTTRETNAKTDIGYGGVSKSAEPANSAPRNSSTLPTNTTHEETSLMHL